jgi:hypothetical protein
MSVSPTYTVQLSLCCGYWQYSTPYAQYQYLILFNTHMVREIHITYPTTPKLVISHREKLLFFYQLQVAQLTAEQSVAGRRSGQVL